MRAVAILFLSFFCLLLLNLPRRLSSGGGREERGPAFTGGAYVPYCLPISLGSKRRRG